jgi:hypothetical protein
MYKSTLFALLVAFAAAGWSEAQLPAIPRPAANQPAVRQPSTALGNQAQGTRLPNGNFNQPSTFQNMQTQTGNPYLAPNSQIIPPRNNNLGLPTLIPQGSQANMLLQGPGNTFTVNGQGLQQPLIGAPFGGQFPNGNFNQPSTFGSAPFQAGNPSLTPNSQLAPPNNNNSGMPATGLRGRGAQTNAARGGSGR